MMNVPTRTGPFTFPSPYNTSALRLTDSENAPRGCPARMYPYWCPISNHRGQSSLYVLLGRVGMRPLIVEVIKAIQKIQIVGETSIEGEAQGWYFSDTLPTSFYFLDGPSLRLYDVTNHSITTVFTLDPKHGHHLWQAHSSSDDRAHSATVKDANDQNLGMIVYRNGEQKFYPFPPSMDEGQIDKRGDWLIVQSDKNDVVIDLKTKVTWTIPDAAGAVNHLDAGDGLIVGEDDTSDKWQMTAWNLFEPNAPKRVLQRGTGAWGNGMGHCAVRMFREPARDVVLFSSNETNELKRVPLDGSPVQLVAPGMMAGSAGNYDLQLRGCLDATGEYAIYLTNFENESGPLHAILVKMPGFIPTVPIPLPDPKPEPNPDPKPKPEPGGSMQPLAISTNGTFKEVKLRYDNGYEAVGVPDTFDGRPAHLVPLNDSQKSGHGAELTLVWANGIRQVQHGHLYWDRQPPEFSPDILSEPTGF